MLDRILPPAVVAVEAFRDDPDATLFPAERAVVEHAVAKRRAEFTTARACAHAALERLGITPVPVLPGERGAPGWPDGVTGSITHCEGFRAAAVARAAEIRALGVDAEPNEPLPDGVLGLIAADRERDQLAGLAAVRSDVCWGRLLFSAKESVYKVWFPLARRWLDFLEAEVIIDPPRAAFTARLLVSGPLVNGEPLTVLHGRWLSADGLIATAIALR